MRSDPKSPGAKKGDPVLYDEPIEKVDQDAFAYHVYAEALVNLLRDTIDDERPLNVGLFGEWGAGKTSVINIFKSKVAADKGIGGRTKVVVFNVWRCSDSLRRQFLLFLDGSEGLDTNTRVCDKLDTSSQNTTNHLRLTWPHAGLMLFLALATFLVVNWVSSLTYTPLVGIIVSALISILAVIVGMLSRVMEKPVTITTQYHRLDQPDQFHKKFQEIAQRARRKWQKLVFVFDDLDRCSGQSILDVLSMVKTYLNESGCTYVIPCDDAGIERHITQLHGHGEIEAKEFLRKFFQVSLRLPPLVDEDISRFVQGLVAEVGLPKEIEKVLVAAFWATPRKVKHFLNNLTMLRAVAVGKESDGKIRQGLVSDNLSFLAKIEVIREQWPEFFRLVAEDPYLLNVVDDYIGGRANDAIGSKQESIDHVRKQVGLVNFLRATQDVMTDDVSAFVKLSQPTYLSELGDSQELELRAVAGDEAFVLPRLKDARAGTSYARILISGIDRRLKLGYPDQAFNLLRIAVVSFEDLAKDTQTDIAGDLVKQLSAPGLSTRLQLLDPQKVFGVLLVSQNARGNRLLLSRLAGTEDVKSETVKQFALHFDDLRHSYEEVYNLLKNRLTEIAKQGKAPEALIRTIAEADRSDSRDAVRAMVSEEVLKSLIEGIGSANDDGRRNAELYLRVQGAADGPTRRAFFAKNLVLLKPSSMVDSVNTFALRNLEQALPPPPVALPELGFYASLEKAMVPLASLAHRLPFIGLLFRHWPLVSSEERKKLGGVLVNSVARDSDVLFCSGIVESLNRFSVGDWPEIESVWSALATRSVQLNERELDMAVCRHYLGTAKLSDYLKRRLAANQLTATKTIATIEPEVQQSSVDADTCLLALIESSRSNVLTQPPGTFETALLYLPKATPECADTFGDRMLEMLNNYASSANQKLALPLVDKTKSHLRSTKRAFIAQQIVSNLPRPIDVPRFLLASVPIQAVLGLQEDLPTDGRRSLVDYLLPVVTYDGWPAQVRIEAATLLSDFWESIPSDRKSQVDDGVETSHKTATDAKVLEALKQLYNKGSRSEKLF